MPQNVVRPSQPAELQSMTPAMECERVPIDIPSERNLREDIHIAHCTNARNVDPRNLLVEDVIAGFLAEWLCRILGTQ